jgi:hypothetical protein
VEYHGELAAYQTKLAAHQNLLHQESSCESSWKLPIYLATHRHLCTTSAASKQPFLVSVDIGTERKHNPQKRGMCDGCRMSEVAASRKQSGVKLTRANPFSSPSAHFVASAGSKF